MTFIVLNTPSSQTSNDSPQSVYSYYLSGTIIFLPVASGCWHIQADNGSWYLVSISKLPYEFQIDGLRVNFSGDTSNRATSCMSGILIELTSITYLNSNYFNGTGTIQIEDNEMNSSYMIQSDKNQTLIPLNPTIITNASLKNGNRVRFVAILQNYSNKIELIKIGNILEIISPEPSIIENVYTNWETRYLVKFQINAYKPLNLSLYINTTLLIELQSISKGFSVGLNENITLDYHEMWDISSILYIVLKPEYITGKTNITLMMTDCFGYSITDNSTVVDPGILNSIN